MRCLYNSLSNNKLEMAIPFNFDKTHIHYPGLFLDKDQPVQRM